MFFHCLRTIDKRRSHKEKIEGGLWAVVVKSWLGFQIEGELGQKKDRGLVLSKRTRNRRGFRL